MSENCRFLGPLEECKFFEQASLAKKLKVLSQNPMGGGKPSVAVEGARYVGSKRIVGLACGSAFHTGIDEKIIEQEKCNAYTPLGSEV